jgi:hypothetical protein
MDLRKVAQDVQGDYHVFLNELNLNKWKDIPCSWIQRLNIKMVMLPKLVCRYDACCVFNEIIKLILCQ